VIGEKGLCAAMKAAWRAGGYEVVGYGEGNTLFINGYGWCAAAPQKQMPRKVLALLVEHVGLIPEGAAYRVQKNEGTQAIVMDMALQAKDAVARLLSEEDAEVIRETAMTWKGRRVWQKAKNLTVLAYDGSLTNIGEGEPDAFGNMLVWDEGGEMVCVMPEPDVLDLSLRELLEQTMLAGE
jgi:hypothetical protein